MHDGSLVDSGVSASFKGRDGGGNPCIRFHDPAYVRTETILFDVKTRAAYAVLHENEIFIGYVPEDIAQSFSSNEDITLEADHYNGNHVYMKAKIAVL